MDQIGIFDLITILEYLLPGHARYFVAILLSESPATTV
jgi:hypothetical protein